MGPLAISASGQSPCRAEFLLTGPAALEGKVIPPSHRAESFPEVHPWKQGGHRRDRGHVGPEGQNSTRLDKQPKAPGLGVVQALSQSLGEQWQAQALGVQHSGHSVL